MPNLALVYVSACPPSARSSLLPQRGDKKDFSTYESKMKAYIHRKTLFVHPLGGTRGTSGGGHAENKNFADVKICYKIDPNKKTTLGSLLGDTLKIKTLQAIKLIATKKSY